MEAPCGSLCDLDQNSHGIALSHRKTLIVNDAGQTERISVDYPAHYW